MSATVAGLFVYPVKSLGGIAVERYELDEFGPHLDRRWMVIDGAGAFQTQRWRPRMALIRTALTEHGSVRLTAPGMEELIVPPGGGRSREVTVWKDTCRAEGCGAEADQWLSTFLGGVCRMVYMPDSTVRPIGRAAPAPGRVSFADAYPLLLLSEASLADLNSRLDEPLPMNRFRPNIVVGGVPAFAEDGWRGFAAGDVRFAVTKQCVRCVLTTIDQETAAGGVEPLRTLATYRRVADGVVFGVNLAHGGPGRIVLGDSVVPVATA